MTNLSNFVAVAYTNSHDSPRNDSSSSPMA